MEVTLSPEAEDFVRDQVARGAYRTESEVVEDGLLSLRLHDPLGSGDRSDLKELIQLGLDALRAGRTVNLDDSELERIKAEARVELAAERRTTVARYQACGDTLSRGSHANTSS